MQSVFLRRFRRNQKVQDDRTKKDWYRDGHFKNPKVGFWIGENHVKKSLIIAFILALAGMYISTELTAQSISVAVDGTTTCTAGNDGCLKAQLSDYSKLFGIPISIFGSSFYLAGALMLVLAVFWNLRQRTLSEPCLLGPRWRASPLFSSALSVYEAAIYAHTVQRCMALTSDCLSSR